MVPSESTVSTPGSQATGVSAERFARLGRGINLSHWFAQARSYQKAHFESYITLEDIQLIKAIGFSHVRFTLNPVILLNEQDPKALDPDIL